MGDPLEPSALTFLGAAGTVTGSATLVEHRGRRILVDCGLFQGRKELRLRNWDPFPVDPATIDAVVLTHAHVDHCGAVPRLVRAGFAGPVLCTRGTQRLASIVLPDSGHLQEEEADFANRHGYSKHHPALPLYTEQDAVASLARFRAVDFGATVPVTPGIEAVWRRSGHILGAASVRLRLTGPSPHELVWSGDLGRSTHPLLVPPEPVESADVVIVESTYGDEDHPTGDPEEVIADVVTSAARRGGVVVIPAFAVDRTEIVLWHLDRLTARGAVPRLPVFVDSPMACRALDVYQDEVRAGSPEVRRELAGSELFPALDVTEVVDVERSKELNGRPGPMIVVSASGMATGGRVVHHLAQRLGDDRNAVLLVGFQAPGTRGDALASGARELRMFGREFPVRARVTSLALSSHADRGELADWLTTASPVPRLVLVNHGEPPAAAAMADLVRRRLGVETRAVVHGERVALDP